MPKPKTYPKNFEVDRSDKLNMDHLKATGVGKFQRQFMGKRHGVVAMLNALWPEGNGSDGSFIRDENGEFEILNSQEMPLPPDGNYKDRITAVNYINKVVAFFEHNPEGRLQLLFPEDSKPHYLSVSEIEGKKNFVISDKPVPPPPEPQKPSWWDRFKSIFVKVPSVEDYKAKKAVFDNYSNYCKKAQNITDKRAADELKAEQEEQARQKEEETKQKAAQEKQKAEEAKQKAAQENLKKEQAKSKEVVQQKKTTEKVSVNNHPTTTFENIVPKNEAAKKFFDKVDAAVAKDSRLKRMGFWAKKGMNEICGGPEKFNNFETALGLMSDKRISGMAYVTAFNMMQKYPYVLETYKGNPTDLVNRVGTRNPKFLEAAGINTQEFKIEKEKWTAFVESGGMNMEESFVEIATGGYIAPKDKLVPGKVPVQQQPTKVNNHNLSV